MATLREKLETIRKYPKEDFNIPRWLPVWPEGGTWSKRYVISNLEYLIFLEESGNHPETREECFRVRKDYIGLIDEAYKIAKKELEK